jgi:hypothetical protein
MKNAKIWSKTFMLLGKNKKVLQNGATASCLTVRKKLQLKGLKRSKALFFIETQKCILQEN